MSFKVVGIGEILWDFLSRGKHLGGAPANFAIHAHALGAESCVISRVGKDPLGAEILEHLTALGLLTASIQIDQTAPTGTVTVELQDDGQPLYTIHENVAWDRLALEKSALDVVANADAVSFGTLAQRFEPSRSTIRSLVSAAGPRTLRILDLNLREKYFSLELIETSLRMANVVKFNTSELPVISDLLGLRGSVLERIGQLAQRYSLRMVCLTRDVCGSLLYSEGKWTQDAGKSIILKDPVGAGDAFTAALAVGMLDGKPLVAINRRANRVAQYVCTREGATPQLPDFPYD